MNKKRPTEDMFVYTVPEVAALLGVSLPTAYVMARSNEFPVFHVGKRVLIPKPPFQEWLNKRAVGRRLSSSHKQVQEEGTTL